MPKEMDYAEIKKFVGEHPGIFPIHIGSEMFGWRSYRLTPAESRRIEILENNIDPRGSENIKLFKYISTMTHIPTESIETFSVQHGALIVVPIIYKTGTV